MPSKKHTHNPLCVEGLTLCVLRGYEQYQEYRLLNLASIFTSCMTE